MIHNEMEYRRAVIQITEYHLLIAERRDHLSQWGTFDETTDSTLRDLTSKCRILENEVATYERRGSLTWVAAN